MLKLSQLSVAATAFLHLKDASGEPLFFMPGVTDAGSKAEKLPVGVTIHGPGSEQHRQAQAKAQRRVMVLAKKGKRALEDRTPEERAAAAADLLADITADCSGIDLEGRSLPEFMRALYADPANGYITEQVNAFAADWANFSKSAPTA